MDSTTGAGVRRQSQVYPSIHPSSSARASTSPTSSPGMGHGCSCDAGADGAFLYFFVFDTKTVSRRDGRRPRRRTPSGASAIAGRMRRPELVEKKTVIDSHQIVMSLRISEIDLFLHMCAQELPFDSGSFNGAAAADSRSDIISYAYTYSFYVRQVTKNSGYEMIHILI